LGRLSASFTRPSASLGGHWPPARPDLKIGLKRDRPVVLCARWRYAKSVAQDLVFLRNGFFVQIPLRQKPLRRAIFFAVIVFGAIIFAVSFFRATVFAVFFDILIPSTNYV